ncbi:Rpn family recombination-promoting nuclease/putative transposase [Persicobacter sp. CCB-QB2]|uniref:Rpn family recombination-promoting nuclease/putative transposase n=1 Tax=Persicobacter sp. CCB-QB2 TaxID=1561025 RepID=UPI00092E73B7|nr:Rpn family recombination-promoting nuclease/putative transposase [Persicobacter sp. CCB-QB2]
MPKDIYIDPFTDFGFKKLFGEEESKEHLIDFLNQILPKEDLISHLQYGQNEHLPKTALDRKAIFDLYCTNQSGEHFIIELQRATQMHIVDRSIYYSSFLIQQQGRKGKNWNYQLQKVYVISILDFLLEERLGLGNALIHHGQIMEIHQQQPLSNKLNYLFIEVPKFNKAPAELKNRKDQWLFLLKNLPNLQKRPKALQERIFQRFFDRAKIAKLPPEEAEKYIIAKGKMGDYKNTLDYREAKGIEKGIEKGKLEEKENLALKLHAEKFPLTKIAKILEVDQEQIEQWIKASKD